MNPARSRDADRIYEHFYTSDNARVIAGDIKIIFMPSARELLELLSGSDVGNAIYNAERIPGNEDNVLARIDSLDPMQSANRSDNVQSWKTNDQAFEKLEQCLEVLDPFFQQKSSLHQNFLKLRPRLRVEELQVHEETVLLVQHSPQPTYSLCCGVPQDAIEALKETTERCHHHGLFWDVREQLYPLHHENDSQRKKHSITIQFLSVDEDVGCWKMLQAWHNQSRRECPDMKQELDKKKRTLTLDNICVLDKLQNSFCGVHVTFKVIHNSKHFSKVQGTADKKEKTFSVLCFSLLDTQKFGQVCTKWATMRTSSMRKAPDAFLGISQERGDLRQTVTTPRSSIQTVPREMGQLAADNFGEDVPHGSLNSNDHGHDACNNATRLYVEIAQGNDSARATFFPTLIGCAVAYTCFAQSKTTS